MHLLDTVSPPSCSPSTSIPIYVFYRFIYLFLGGRGDLTACSGFSKNEGESKYLRIFFPFLPLCSQQEPRQLLCRKVINQFLSSCL